MSMNKLKTEFIKKTNLNQSAEFDKQFFKKLASEKTALPAFNLRRFFPYMLASTLTLSAILFNINNDQVSQKNSNEYRQYILETQMSLDEDTSDLTEDALDEI